MTNSNSLTHTHTHTHTHTPTPTTPGEEGDAFPKVFISKWIDYSNKYGLGYQLRDGAVGVYFNDSTSIILSADNVHFEYLYYEFQRAASSSASATPIIHRDAHRMHDFPAALTKKVTLLKHFRGYMTDNLTKVWGGGGGLGLGVYRFAAGC